MFSKIRIQNYKSIDDLTVDFSYAEGKAPNRYKDSNILAFLEPNRNTRDRKVPALAIYGANASGKSNFIECIYNFFNIISNGYRSEFYIPNKLNSPIIEKTSIELECFIKSEKMIYVLEFGKDSITKEILKNKHGIIFEVNKNKLKCNKSIETKIYDIKYFKEIFNTACLHINENGEYNQVNTFLNSIVEKLPNLNSTLTQLIYCFKNKLIISNNNSLNPIYSLEILSKINKKNNQESANEILNIMQKLNIDISKIDYLTNSFPRNNTKSVGEFNPVTLELNQENIVVKKLISYHSNKDGENIPFDFIKEESIGTKLAFGLIGPILKILYIGGVLIIDEIDSSLHPLILLPLIKLFKDKTINKNNAQLIFTSHTTEILEDGDFRVSEFLFMNKSQKKGTFARRLTDFEEVKNIRNDINFRKRYLKGFYLGIPYPTI